MSTPSPGDYARVHAPTSITDAGLFKVVSIRGDVAKLAKPTVWEDKKVVADRPLADLIRAEPSDMDLLGYSYFPYLERILNRVRSGEDFDAVVRKLPNIKSAPAEVKELLRARVSQARGIRGAASRVAAAWLERIGRNAKNPVRLVMFDFDGTLFNSEETAPDWWTVPGQYSWGMDPRSLMPPCVPEHPTGSDYWNMRVVQAAKEATQDPFTHIVVITGRVPAHEARIKELLAQQGIRPDRLYLNVKATSAAAFKKKVFGSLMIKFPTLRALEIWENENQEAYGSFVREFSRRLETEIDLEVHHVSEKHVPATCGPDDFLVSAGKRAYEVYVDENGYAYDDEGNKEYVGKGYSGETYSGTRVPWQNRHAPPARGNPAQLDALDKLLARREDRFIRSIRNQVADGKRLSPDQLKAVRQNFYRASLRTLADLFR